ncbi:Hypothetical predicted protein, partial [Mytilus galloprovincialis]
SKNSEVTLRQTIITAAVSSAITIVLMITVIIGVLIARRFLCTKQQVGPAVSSNDHHLSSLQEQSSVIQRNAIPDSQYETIDELNMIETIGMNEDTSGFRTTNISNSSSDSKTSNASGVTSEDTEGYLHPYNTLEENWQNKGYHYSPCIVKTDK